jgi:hypothetical protein
LASKVNHARFNKIVMRWLKHVGVFVNRWIIATTS